MIGVTEARSTELLPLRIRLPGVGTIDEETDRRDYQPSWQIHLSRKEICPKNRSHPSLGAGAASCQLSLPSISTATTSVWEVVLEW